MNPKNNVDEFFQNLPEEDKQEADIFNDKSLETNQASGDADDKDDPEKVSDEVKNRRHRRLEQRLQAEREANIALTERLKVVSEMDKFAKENKGEINPDIAKLFDSSDLGKESALRFSQVIRNVKEEAKTEALRELQSIEIQTKAEEAKYEQQIDNELESLEDEYNVDLTSDSPKARKARREFLELVQELSPKDESGTITGYADFDATFKMYQKTHTEERPNSQKKEIAARSMQRGGQSNGTTTQITRGFDGWKKDYNLN